MHDVVSLSACLLLVSDYKPDNLEDAGIPFLPNLYLFPASSLGPILNWK